eukprot:COSAG02_NODE_2034_length_10056_cov_5.336748_5_plen_60_part_00
MEDAEPSLPFILHTKMKTDSGPKSRGKKMAAPQNAGSEVTLRREIGGRKLVLCGGGELL